MVVMLMVVALGRGRRTAGERNHPHGDVWVDVELFLAKYKKMCCSTFLTVVDAVKERQYLYTVHSVSGGNLG